MYFLKKLCIFWTSITKGKMKQCLNEQRSLNFDIGGSYRTFLIRISLFTISHGYLHQQGHKLSNCSVCLFQYEQEVTLLKQQLYEAQQRLQFAEEKLYKHEADSHEVMEDWQFRLEESEERMRRQQAEKDDQMKNIITRLVNGVPHSDLN